MFLMDIDGLFSSLIFQGNYDKSILSLTNKNIQCDFIENI